MIERLILFGASGDLAGRFLFPAMAALADAGELPERFEVIGAAGSGWNDQQFRERVAGRLELHARQASPEARGRVLKALSYRQADVSDAASVSAAVGGSDGPTAVYLAVPPSVFPPAVSALAQADLPAGSRLALEKPFGESLSSAVALNSQLAESFDEEQIYRVDHVLGMATTENLLALRFANRVFEALWSSRHIVEVELLWEETLALEGRAGYYDDAGALRDVVQNHLMQLLAVVAMEPGPGPLHARKSALLRAVRPVAPERTRRGRYTAGRLIAAEGEEAQEVPAYVDEEGVDPGKQTETFAQIEIEIDNDRWRGTRFVLRAGKALAERRKEVVVHFEPYSHPPFGLEPEGRTSNALRIGIDGPTDITLQLTGCSALESTGPLELAATEIRSKLPAYGRVLREFLRGGSDLAVGAAEAETAWRIVTPVLEAWQHDTSALEGYTAGSKGPSATRSGRSLSG